MPFSSRRSLDGAVKVHCRWNSVAAASTEPVSQRNNGFGSGAMAE